MELTKSDWLEESFWLQLLVIKLQLGHSPIFLDRKDPSGHLPGWLFSNNNYMAMVYRILASAPALVDLSWFEVHFFNGRLTSCSSCRGVVAS